MIVWFGSIPLKKELPGRLKIFPGMQNTTSIHHKKISPHRNEGTPKFKN
jgi:hypothetical protein